MPQRASGPARGVAHACDLRGERLSALWKAGFIGVGRVFCGLLFSVFGNPGRRVEVLALPADRLIELVNWWTDVCESVRFPPARVCSYLGVGVREATGLVTRVFGARGRSDQDTPIAMITFSC